MDIKDFLSSDQVVIDLVDYDKARLLNDLAARAAGAARDELACGILTPNAPPLPYPAPPRRRSTYQFSRSADGRPAVAKATTS